MTWKTRFTRIYDIRPSVRHSSVRPSVRPPLIRPSVSAFYPNPLKTLEIKGLKYGVNFCTHTQQVIMSQHLHGAACPVAKLSICLKS